MITLRSFWICLFLAVIAGGCATAPPSAPPTVERKAPPPENVAAPESLPPQEVPTVPPAPATGTVFGKTFFKGVLKTSYVKLSLVDLSDETKQYHLYIGEQLGPAMLPWNTRSVEPGYFFLELPVGDYRIHSISIPVGSTTATEAISLVFSVKAQQASYIGTLEVNGINEKVKFGGVPIIVPGFDYLVNVRDEREDAIKEFHHRYPLAQTPIEIDLIRNEGIHTTTY